MRKAFKTHQYQLYHKYNWITYTTKLSHKAINCFLKKCKQIYTSAPYGYERLIHNQPIVFTFEFEVKYQPLYMKDACRVLKSRIALQIAVKLRMLKEYIGYASNTNLTPYNIFVFKKEEADRRTYCVRIVKKIFPVCTKIQYRHM